MSEKVRIDIYLDHEVARELEERVGVRHRSAFINNLLIRQLSRDGENMLFKEVFTNTPIGDALEWMLGRRPVVCDFSGNGNSCLDARLANRLRDLLPAIQARRIRMALRGMSLEEIGRKEGCSKQAVSMSLHRGYKTLGRSESFLRSLFAMAAPETNIDPFIYEVTKDGNTK